VRQNNWAGGEAVGKYAMCVVNKSPTITTNNIGQKRSHPITNHINNVHNNVVFTDLQKDSVQQLSFLQSISVSHFLMKLLCIVELHHIIPVVVLPLNMTRDMFINFNVTQYSSDDVWVNVHRYILKCGYIIFQQLSEQLSPMRMVGSVAVSGKDTLKVRSIVCACFKSFGFVFIKLF
jgi:hypothetical protein